MKVNSKQHHILVISSWWPTHKKSVGTFVELHIKGLVSRGCKCTLLLVSESTIGTHMKQGFRSKELIDYRYSPEINFIKVPVVHKGLLRFAKDPISKRKQNILSAVKNELDSYIEQEGKLDLIFHHGVFNYCYLTTYLANNYDLPVWYMENSPNIEAGSIPCANDFDTEHDLLQFVKVADRRFAVTDDYVKKMKTVFGVSFELCPNILTDDFFIDPGKRINPDSYFQFVNVAILDKRKNQELLIRAFAKKYGGDMKYRLTIAGDGDLKSHLRRLSKELEVQNQVSIPGFVNREELRRLLDNSHVFVLTSKAETFGVVVIEAMARCLPVISSNIAGTREIINDSNGLLFNEGDLDDLIFKMETIEEKYTEYDPLEISISVKTKYSPDASFKALFGHA